MKKPPVMKRGFFRGGMDCTYNTGMACLAMYSTPVHPDGWHAVTAPGGYEWWYFDAEDLATDTRVVAILFQGFVFHPGYLRRHARYLRNPTKRLPALAAEYPCAYLVVYRDGRIWRQFMTQYPAGEFEASSDSPMVRVGPNRLRPEGGDLKLELTGSPWRVTGRGPKLIEGETLSASLTFRPTIDHTPVERTFLSRRMTGADHKWILANPLCGVTGEIRCGGETIALSGRGYHDHNYGTGPLGPGLKRWMWGRVLLDDRMMTFHFVQPREGRLGDEAHLVEVDGAGAREHEDARVMADWSGRTGLGLRYPRAMEFSAGGLTLSNPRVVDPSPFYLRLVYDAQWGASRGEAMCEIAYPHRLRWPVLGRMIEMSIDRRDEE